jgi:hypothetical protein
MRPPHRHPRCPGAHCRTLLQTVWDLGGGSNGTKSGAENVDVALDIAGQARVCRCAGFPTPLTPHHPRAGGAPHPQAGEKNPAKGRTPRNQCYSSWSCGRGRPPREIARPPNAALALQVFTSVRASLVPSSVVGSCHRKALWTSM